MDLLRSIDISASGMAAQSRMMKVTAENIANADSVMTETGEAYRKQQVFFKTEVDRATGMNKVVVADVKPDTKTPFNYVYEPAHPLANEKGFVAYPNVNTFTENTNMRAAARSYEANMQAIEAAKSMASRSLDLLR